MARVELTVELEDGRLTGWELVEARHTRQGTVGSARALSSEVAGNAVQGVLPFTEGLGPRTVRLVLRVEHRTGEAEARGRVEEARVERPSLALALTPERSWYHAMHEAILLRWREGVYEGSAWLAEKGVEEAALWFVGGMVGKGLGSFMTKGLEWVPKALGREPEVAAGWLRSALKRLPNQEQKTFEQLWRKVALEGEQALNPERALGVARLLRPTRAGRPRAAGSWHERNASRSGSRLLQGIVPSARQGFG